MVLRFYTRMIDEGTCIRHKTTHGSPYMTVNFGNFFDGLRIQQGGRQPLFDCQDCAFLGLQTDCRRAKFDGFNSVFDLRRE
jgi:hypothetical protein